MKVKEMRELIDGLKSSGKLTSQTVEFVLDAKKFFASEVKAGANTMTLEITRDNYFPLTIENFESTLALASGELEIHVKQGNNQKAIGETYLTDSTLELVIA